ncbi:hypothetical protein KUCAC02_029591, partial [Chaenocephalus aceratus]
ESDVGLTLIRPTDCTRPGICDVRNKQDAQRGSAEMTRHIQRRPGFRAEQLGKETCDRLVSSGTSEGTRVCVSQTLRDQRVDSGT